MLPSKITLSHRTLLHVLYSNTKDKWSLMSLLNCNKLGIVQQR